MPPRPIAAAVLVIALAVVCTAQRPLLQLGVSAGDAPNDPGGGGFNLSITNAADVPAIAYQIDVKSHDSEAVAGGTTIWVNAGMPGGEQIGPGATTVQHIGTTRMPPGIDPSRVIIYFAGIDSVSDLAVLYADGTSAGDSQVVNLFLLERKTTLDSIGQAIALLTDPSTASLPRQDLASKLKLLGEERDTILNQANADDPPQHFDDVVLLGASMLAAHERTPLADIVASLRARQAALEASAPR